MDKKEIRRLMDELSSRVTLESEDSREVRFDPPDAATLISLGFDESAVGRMLSARWWPEMAEEIVETPAFCGADEAPAEVLRYARDVVVEYIRKRFEP